MNSTHSIKSTFFKDKWVSGYDHQNRLDMAKKMIAAPVAAGFSIPKKLGQFWVQKQAVN